MKHSIILFVFLCCLTPLSGFCQLFGEDKSKLEFAWEKFRSGNYSSAIRYCTELIENLSVNRRTEVYKLRAMAFRASGDFIKAAIDYNEVIQYGRKDPSVFVDLAQVYICQKDFDKADEKLSEALRLFREQQPGKQNNFILEELGRVRLYMGDYNEAVQYLKEAVENQSAMAQIDLLSALFHNNDFAGVKFYSDTLLQQSKTEKYGLLSDSALFYYVWSLNSIARSSDAEQIYPSLEKAVRFYRNLDNRCFKGFYNDILAAQAYLYAENGKDSLAYSLYKVLNTSNPRQLDVSWRLKELKVKLNFDQFPPTILIKNPNIDASNSFEVVNAIHYEMYGQVNDSSGIQSVTVNNHPIQKIEEDGLFVYTLELQPGLNEIEVEAIDKNDNKAVKKFLINNKQGETAQAESLIDIPDLETTIKFHAILIGENDYEDPKFTDLKKPSQNVNELKEILMKDYQFQEQNIMVINNGTKAQILDSMEKKAESLDDNDNLLVFYAGHGTVRRMGNEIIGGYLVPVDAKKEKWTSYLSSNDLKEPFRETAARHLLFVVDACFGGALFRSSMDDAPSSIKQAYFARSRKMLTSGNLEEVADDSKFFENLKMFLNNNSIKYTRAQELAVFLQKNAELNNPQYDRIPDLGDNGGQFIFVKASSSR